MKFIYSLALTFGLAAARPGSPAIGARAPVTALSVSQRFDYTLGYQIKPNQANNSVPIYVVDLFDTPASTISSLKQNHYVICYFSAGTYENWRPDADQFPTSAKGSADPEWRGENWVNTNDATVRKIMVNRIALAQQKGCQAVDPDNIDGYAPDDDGNDKTGFNLQTNDLVTFVKLLADAAHSRGMKCGQKNAPEIVPQLVQTCDFAVVEECVSKDECSSYNPYILAGKPVFHVEYRDVADYPGLAASCASQGYSSFSTIIKNKALDAYVYQCK